MLLLFSYDPMLLGWNVTRDAHEAMKIFSLTTLKKFLFMRLHRKITFLLCCAARSYPATQTKDIYT